MARARIIHWRPEEAERLLEVVRSCGFTADYTESTRGADITRAIQECVPEVVVIDLSRLPSHGKEIGVWLRGRKATRHVPLIFVDGEPEKVAKVRDLLPDAAFVARQDLAGALGTATPNTQALVPPPIMERYGGRTVAQKIGMKPNSQATVMDPPRDYRKVIGELPDGAELVEDPDAPEAVTLWFIHEPEGFLAALPRMRTIATKTKLWVLWRKGRKNGLNQNFVREAGIDSGLVDYKICSVSDVWSGMAFARKKT